MKQSVQEQAKAARVKANQLAKAAHLFNDKSNQMVAMVWKEFTDAHFEAKRLEELAKFKCQVCKDTGVQILHFGGYEIVCECQQPRAVIDKILAATEPKS